VEISRFGSTSLVTDASGALITKTLYRPCPLHYRYGVLREGEIRYAWKDPSLNTTPAYKLTSYTYTGQFSYMDDPTTSATEGFGLMYYGVRMYDPYLNHFTQPDTIVPEQSQGTQAWDRYAFVNNNPVRYNDPTGHGLGDWLKDVGSALMAIGGVMLLIPTPLVQAAGAIVFVIGAVVYIGGMFVQRTESRAPTPKPTSTPTPTPTPFQPPTTTPTPNGTATETPILVTPTPTPTSAIEMQIVTDTPTPFVPQ
jgi:RHS repeat-associated protein